ncbi:MAG TPA: hypothetical protein VE931_09145 [Pyrinomonadaceae bacterium]|nr:hypothetical protein [Pyrinomonadaceae bacterium]
MRTLILCVVIALTFCACSSSNRPAVEAPPVAYQPSPQSTLPVQLTSVADPKQSEVQEAVKRVFKDAAVVDTNYNPSFLSGDFNGDGSQDLAVILKPAKLDLMNQELPPWLVRQPRNHKAARAPAPIEKDETLLAVIHGFGANHWRDPDATQTFVLKDVVGQNLKVQSLNEFVTANSGKKLPRPQGDLIGETVEGTVGYLYYAQATYSWYDPKTFDPNAGAPGVFHKSRTMK